MSKEKIINDVLDEFDFDFEEEIQIKKELKEISFKGKQLVMIVTSLINDKHIEGTYKQIAFLYKSNYDQISRIIRKLLNAGYLTRELIGDSKYRIKVIPEANLTKVNKDLVKINYKNVEFDEFDFDEDSTLNEDPKEIKSLNTIDKAYKESLNQLVEDFEKAKLQLEVERSELMTLVTKNKLFSNLHK